MHRSTSVDFNCLDLVVSVKSWVVVLDFFSASAGTSHDVVDASTSLLENEQNGAKGK